MIRTQEATGKTVDEARTNACALLGVEKDDINVSYEVLEMPQKTGFLGLKLTPAKVRVSVELPDEPVAAPAAPVEEPTPVVEEKAAPVAAEPVVEETAPEAPAAVEEPAAPTEEAAPAEEQAAPAAEGEEVEVPINIEENAKVKAAVDYLKDVIEKMGALIGRRGETMESLSYLASLVANRLEGDYIKLGLDVAGYRDKRESDLTALAQRIGAKVRRTGRSFAMEPMNPYERRIIHSAIGKMEGVRSESKGEGRDRRVVIYSTDPNAMAESANARLRGPRGGHDRNGNGRSGGIIAAASAVVTGMAVARAMAAAVAATAPMCLSAPTPRAMPRMLPLWHPSALSVWMTSLI